MLSFIRIVVKGLLIVSVLVIIGVGALAVRLSIGPMDISFLRPTIERALSASDGSYSVKAGATEISWEGWDNGLRLTLKDVQLQRADASVFASLPLISIRLDGGSLLGGRLQPSEVAVHRPQLLLRRSAQGEITLGVTLAKGRRRTQDGLVPGLLSALRKDANTPPALSKLRTVRIVDADLVVEDAFLERTWRTTDFDVKVWREGKQLAAEMYFNLLIGQKSIRFSARAAEQANSPLISLSLRFKALDPALFRAARGPMAALGWFQLPLAGAFFVTIDRKLQIRRARFQVGGRNGTLRIPNYYSRGLPVREFHLAGSVSGDGSVLQISRLTVDLNGPKLRLTGVASRVAETADFKGTVSLDGFPVERLGEFWPEQAKTKARTWVVTNITKGNVSGIDMTVAMRVMLGKQPEIMLQRLRGAFRFSGLQVRFFEHMPPVTGAGGLGTFDDKGMKFTVDRAMLEDLKLSRATVDIDGFRGPARHLHVAGRVRGSLQTALKIIDREPLGFSRKLGVSPLAINGDVEFGLDVWVALLSPVDFNDIGIRVLADLSKVHWRKGFFGLTLTGGKMKLRVEKRGMAVEGNGLLEGRPAKFHWEESFIREPVRRRMQMQGRFSSNDILKVGFDPGSLVAGQFGARLSMIGRDDGVTHLDGVFDMRQSAVVLPYVGVRKPVGQPASLRMRLTFQNQRLMSISGLYLKGQGYDLSGSAQFYPVQPPRLRRLVIDRVRAGLTDLSATLSVPVRGPRLLVIKGRSFDLSRTIDMRGKSSDEPLPPMIVRANVDKVYFRRGYPFLNLTGAATFDGRDWRSINAQATAGGGVVSVRLSDDSRRRRLSFRAANAGATLRALNVFDEIKGGEIKVDAALNAVSGSDLFVGKAVMTKFRVQNAPAAARLLALASSRGIGNFNARDKGVSMDEFIAPVRFQRGLIQVRNGRVVGSQLGITLNGWINLKTDRVDIRGTIVPAYSINNLLGKLTAAATGSGLFAASYQVAGPLKDPRVMVNPLSIIAPPLLRRLLNTYSGKEDDSGWDKPGQINQDDPLNTDSIGR